MRILLDTDILLRSIEPAHEQFRSTLSAVETLRQNRHELSVVPQVLYEFWAVATRPVANNGQGLTLAEARAELGGITRLFRFLRDERAVYSQWESLVLTLEVRGKQAHDARLAAAMRRHAITHLLTHNTADFLRDDGITPVSPLDVVRGTGPL